MNHEWKSSKSKAWPEIDVRGIKEGEGNMKVEWWNAATCERRIITLRICDITILCELPSCRGSMDWIMSWSSPCRNLVPLWRSGIELRLPWALSGGLRDPLRADSCPVTVCTDAWLEDPPSLLFCNAHNKENHEWVRHCHVTSLSHQHHPSFQLIKYQAKISKSQHARSVKRRLQTPNFLFSLDK